MKRNLILIGAIFSLLTFTGCGGGSSTEYSTDVKDTIYLVDSEGFSVSGIDYVCDDNIVYTTGYDGSMSFYPGDTCSLYLDYPIVDSEIDSLQLLYYDDRGVQDLEYDCVNGDFGFTDFNGGFYFDNVYSNDTCTFFL